MTRLARTLLALGLFLAACTPVASGPLLPRPEPEAVPVTVATEPDPPTTTAPVATRVVAVAPDCPTEFCLVYHIDPRATWSDGSPVTADDFAHTVALHDGAGPTLQAPDYSRVTDVEVLDDRTALVAFSEPYGAWQTLFSRVYRAGRPAGAIGDVDTTGPFRLVEWEEGDHVTLARDREWWATRDPLSGEPLGDVSRITFVFIDTLQEMVDALEAGEIDVFAARPDVAAVDRLDGMEGVDYTVAPGPFWEHIDFHHDDPMLAQRWVREVFSLAIDREKVLDRTVRLLDPAAGTLDNTVWMSGTANYEAHFKDVFDPERARQMMADNGCEVGNDGIYVCDGTRMSFVWGSTNDDSARREIFASVSEDLAVVGIEVVPDFRSPSDFVTRDFLFGGPDVWQLVNFSWRARPDPFEANPTYYCEDAGDLNVNRYCSDQLERIVRTADTEARPDDRAAIYNRADRMYLEDIALIPLYQKPTIMAWDSEIEGPEPNYTASSDLWNVASWTGKSSIVVALVKEPVDLSPMSLSDDSANVILSALLYGAFGMDPAQEHLPVLIESVDVITEGG